MRKLALLAVLLAAAPMAGADVIRCADAAGNVSYTDAACPTGAKKVARVSTVEPISVVRGADKPRPAANVESTDVAAAPPPAPSAPIIIDGRRDGNAGGAVPDNSRWSDRGVDSIVIDDGSMYAAPGVSRPPRPRDMRPRIRSCGSRTCEDTQGNHFTHSGQLDRYRSIDGRTCQPVGTTTVCR